MKLSILMLLSVSSMIGSVSSQRGMTELSGTSILVSSSQNQTEDVSIETLIVGGIRASAYPWFASTTGNYVCGASLVHPKVLLTAAHCKDAFAPGRRVLIGSNYRNSLQPGSHYRTVQRAISHPDYDAKVIVNDLMLLELDEAVPNTPLVQLNTDNSFPTDSDTIITTMGYGRTSPDGTGPISYSLLQVDLYPVAHDTCAEQYKRVVGTDGKTRLSIQETSMMCAAAPDASACHGDSGGPAVATNAQGQVVQVGIVSFGVGCANPDYPGVYVRVSGVVDWIQQGICHLSSSSSSDQNNCNADVSPPADQDTLEDEQDAREKEQDLGLEEEEDLSEEEEDTELAEDEEQDEEDDKKNKKKKNKKEKNNEDEKEFAPTFLRVQFEYDQDVDDTLWTISQSETILYYGPRDYTPEPWQVWSTTLEGLEPGGAYNFSIYDSACDGGGSFQLFAVQREEEVLLTQTDGTFDCSQIVGFVWNGAAAMEEKSSFIPAVVPCQDSIGPSIKMTASETRTCTWLTNHWDEYRYLCDWIDVAMACPVTCDVPCNNEITACSNQDGNVEIDATVGEQSCDWLWQNVDRYEFACRRTAVAFHCPATCNIANC